MDHSHFRTRRLEQLEGLVNGWNDRFNYSSSGHSDTHQFAQHSRPLDDWKKDVDALGGFLVLGGGPSGSNAANTHTYRDIVKDVKNPPRPTVQGDPVTVHPGGSWDDDSSSSSSSSMLSDQDTVAKFTPLSKGFRRSISEPSFDTDTHYCNDVDALIFDIFDDGDKPLVSLIVQGLHQLPVEQRAIVYDLDQDVHQYTDGYSEGTSVQAVATPSDETSTIGDTRSSTSFSIPSSGKPPPGTKRKRQRGEFPFACPFHKFWASKFTIKYGPDGHNRFKSCSGPGWTDIKNLGDHIRNVHLRPQCPRCWKTWGREEERSKHLSQDPRVDCPDNSHNIYQIESVSYDVFSSIKRILSTPRPRKKTSTSKDLVTQLTSRDKWYAVKDEIFPPAKYPEFNPEHPFYQNPDGNLIKSSAAEREEVLQLTKTMVKAKADEAVRTNQVGDADAFRLSSDEVVELVMRVFDLSIGRAESTHSPLPNASGEPSALLQEQPQLHPKPPNLAQGGGQPMPNAINVDDQDVEIRVQLLQFA